MLRPSPARWFELLTSRDELGAVLEALSGTRSVQLQAQSQSGTRLPLEALRGILAQQEALARRYSPCWPAPRLRQVDVEHAVVEAPQAALQALQAWARAAEPVVAELESIAVEQEELAALERLCRATPDRLPRLDRMALAGPVLAGRVYVLPRGIGPLSIPPAVLQQLCGDEGSDERYLLAVGPREDMVDLDAAMSARKVRRIALPPGLPPEPGTAAAELRRRAGSLDEREARARTALRALDQAHALADVLGELALAAWLVAHVPELPVTEHFAWVTGWCSDRDDSRLRAALDGRGLHYLLRWPDAPPGLTAPSVLRNPRWAQPFETMTAMMGVPAKGEADPSLLVAILAPLMFGFMFGDVAQGAVVAVAGYWLGRRLPALRLLLPGGLVAIAFGFAFGSVFAREDLLPPLWLRPLEQPLPVLQAAIAFGVLTILVGLLLDAMQRAWQGTLRRWLASDAGIVLAYLGVVGAFADPRALWALPLGFAWLLGGAAFDSPRSRAGAAAGAAGAGVERILQLSVNTLSFVRVGAFALAHAGLCAAVVGMAEAAGAAYWPVLLIGNAAIVALEGLVVSIQTTRLVLFEFFIRFLTARGRPFEPLAPPPALPGGPP